MNVMDRLFCDESMVTRMSDRPIALRDQAIAQMCVVDVEMPRLCRLRQGLVSDIRTNNPVDVQSVQVGHLSVETLFMDTLHCHRRQQVSDENTR